MFRLFGFILLIISTISVNASEFRDALKLAEQGNAKAQLNLGFMYYSGEGVFQDYKQAAMWFRKAAEQSYVKAQLNLGFMYYSGEGVLQNDKKAYMWVNLARYNGLDTKKAFDVITSKMTSKNISEAQKMSKVCLNSNYKNCG